MGRTKNPDYPKWVCDSCGQDFGDWYKKGSYIGPPHHCATYHAGTCDVCGLKNIPVTEPRDYGHLRAGWQAELIKTHGYNKKKETQD